MPSLFYKESLQVIGLAKQDYSRVMEYTCYDYDYDQLLPNAKEINKEMIGQHVAKYLHDEGQGWVNWFHHESSQFVIARKKSFSGYDIEGAEEGKDRFIGYAALAEWAFKEGIYRKKAFLDEVGLEEDDLNKLFKSTTITARKRKQKIHSTDNAANAKKKKKHDGVDMELREQLVAEFVEEDERIVSEANAAKLSATKDTSPSPSDEKRSSKSSEEESSFGGGNCDGEDGDDDDDEDWKDDETEQQAKVSNPKQVSTTKSKSAQQEPSPSQENDGGVSDVSDLEDDVSGSGVAQSSQQEQEEGEGRDMSSVKNQAVASETEELRAEVDAKSQAEAKLNTKSDELEAVQNEVHRLHIEINDLKADAKSRAEETVTDQDEHRRLHDAIETKNGEIYRLQRELTAVAATSTAQEHIPDYIVKPRDICDDRVAFGSEDEGKAIILHQVSEALSNRDGRTIELAKRWSDAGKSPEEIVEGLVNVKMIENKRKG